MMHNIRSFAAYAALLAAAVAPSYAADNAVDPVKKQQELIAVLKSDAKKADKAITCKYLAIYGTKDAVPVLAPLLADKELASWARIALEAIPDPAVDDALREAMGKLSGNLLIGVINSIAVRRDVKAVDQLVARLKDADAGVASAAGEALGRIGGATAAKALQQSLSSAPPEARSAIAYGCVLCAEHYLDGGKAAEAMALYDAVRKADVPKQRILEATRGAILARGSDGIALLTEQLRSADKELFGIGLRTARELADPKVTDVLAAELRKAAAGRQVPLLLALADRGDAKVLPAAIEAAKSGPTDVRIAAIGVLERLGDASCVGVLLDASLAGDESLAAAATGALRRVGGAEVDADILARLPKASGKTRQVLIEVAARRPIEAALPTIVKAVEDADAGTRAAAVAALGTIGKGENIADLIRVLQKTTDAAEQTALEKAVSAISGREGAACVKLLTPLVRSDKAGLRVVGLHALAAAGGPDALEAVRAAVSDKDEAVQDDAVRTLSTWPNKWPADAAVVEPLLELAKSGKKASHKILALRGFFQYVQGAKALNDAAKLAKVKEILPVIARRDEKRLAISALRNIKVPGALDVLVSYASDPDVVEEACSAIVGLITGRRGVRGATKAQRRKALEAAVEKSKSKAVKQRANQALKALGA